MGHWTLHREVFALQLRNGADGSIWHLSADFQHLYQWKGSGWNSPIKLFARQISATRSGAPIHVGFNGQIYILGRDGWSSIGEANASRVCVGADGRVWHVGRSAIYAWESGSWVQLDPWDSREGFPDPETCGYADEVAVDSNGQVWKRIGQYVYSRDEMFERQA